MYLVGIANLNTSNVILQLIKPLVNLLGQIYLNTSNVILQ